MYLKRQLMFIICTLVSIKTHLVPPEDTEGHDQLKKWCEFAYSCFHDKIYVCGRGAQQTRTFLDVCDMYEYSCETNQTKKRLSKRKRLCYTDKERPPAMVMDYKENDFESTRHFVDLLHTSVDCSRCLHKEEGLYYHGHAVKPLLTEKHIKQQFDTIWTLD